MSSNHTNPKAFAFEQEAILYSVMKMRIEANH
jgi:hypothetical protein